MEEKQFTFFWLDGKRTMCVGDDPADALTKAGYGGGAVRALDFFAYGDNKDYVWNSNAHEWDSIKQEDLHGPTNARTN